MQKSRYDIHYFKCYAKLPRRTGYDLETNITRRVKTKRTKSLHNADGNANLQGHNANHAAKFQLLQTQGINKNHLPNMSTPIWWWPLLSYKIVHRTCCQASIHQQHLFATVIISSLWSTGRSISTAGDVAKPLGTPNQLFLSLADLKLPTGLLWAK